MFEGAVPANPVIKMASDPACASANKDGATPSRSSSTTAALQNVFVYIKDGLGNKYLFDTPTKPVKIDQKGCHYVPHVVGIRAGAAARDRQQRQHAAQRARDAGQRTASSTQGQPCRA